MSKLRLACCKVYVSESRNKAALESVEQASKLFPKAAIVNKFEDEEYNRVGYTLASQLAPMPSSDSCPLRSAVFAMVKAAFQTIDLGLHCGSHPRLGVVDHICFHPLASASLDHATGAARLLANEIGFNLKGLLKASLVLHLTSALIFSIKIKVLNVACTYEINYFMSSHMYVNYFMSTLLLKK